MDLPPTERTNPLTRDLDRLSASEIVRALQAEDARAVEAAARAREEIAAVVLLAHEAFARGGRLVFVGAGTSGRLGALEAAECPPTFSTHREQVRSLLAGGSRAFMEAVEGAEDDGGAGSRDVSSLGTGTRDLVIGVSASGRTPYVLAALERARALGAKTVLVACSPTDALVDRKVVLETGPEAIAGSTRLKAGTATKVVLNAITTGAMVLLGKVHGNLMVDVAPTNAKLRERAARIVSEIAGVEREKALALLEETRGEVKTAVLVARLGLSPERARSRLEAAGGVLRRALEAAP
ncbi:N-acetylmuramic acid 6-phosphate etherase [bacterium]|nr:N-acetylmuramic acid 6-phosphate etherase [bacterium]